LIHDPEIFFPMKGQSQKKAKAVCAACPVRMHCETYAEQAREPAGIWGGKIRQRGA
jgi:hypothetical protein